MKKIIILFTIFTFSFLFGLSQNISPIFNNGYYIGNYNHSNKENVYFFLKFLSIQQDSILIILPYKLKKSTNKSINVSNELKMLKTVDEYINRISDSIQVTEYKEVILEDWTIWGFNNVVYFENIKNKIIININIIDIFTNEIEIFTIEGIISDNRKEIDAIIYSDKNTFELSNIKLLFTGNL